MPLTSKNIIFLTLTILIFGGSLFVVLHRRSWGQDYDKIRFIREFREAVVFRPVACPAGRRHISFVQIRSPLKRGSKNS